MQLNLQEVDRVSSITKEVFLKKYYKTQTPVIIENLTSDWKANKDWSFDYFTEKVGDKIVPLYDNSPVDYSKKFNEPAAEMSFKDYIELLQKGPTELRIFLFNILKEVPELRNDFKFPEIGMPFIKQMPMLFFGGEDSRVFMHYDIDYSNLIHFHFHGEKECILFPPSETKYLYKIPYSLISREDIDFNNPNFEKWPKLAKATGFKVHLKHGEAVYIPEGYWHHMYYKTPGFSMTLRAYPRNIKSLGIALYNLVYMRNYDNLMRKLKGEKWLHYKNSKALQ
ncbi:cupin-like domain-containing protein [Aureivirga sp. CE67]|uniref:cupin-like domain-containing protein n=1 Tax=Aureivirga sp. CE67 TaxID=1788983 RepID=UPI0018C9C9E2|nr:cupin-like domain-containing protein [Aureivirga sp. CE67]